MTPERETALYNLLYNLEAVHHLLEAHFYCTCLVDSKAIPETVLRNCISQTQGMARYVAAEYILLVKDTGLDLPPTLNGADERVVKRCLNRVKAALRTAPNADGEIL